MNFALAGELGLLALTLIVLATPIAALVAGALGLPIGVIGPTLFIDTTAGSLLWQLSQSVGSSRTDPAFFALLGMSAMMGAGGLNHGGNLVGAAETASNFHHSSGGQTSSTVTPLRPKRAHRSASVGRFFNHSPRDRDDIQHNHLLDDERLMNTSRKNSVQLELEVSV